MLSKMVSIRQVKDVHLMPLTNFFDEAISHPIEIVTFPETKRRFLSPEKRAETVTKPDEIFVTIYLYITQKERAGDRWRWSTFPQGYP